MKRLIKSAEDTDSVRKLLNRIYKNSEELKDVYYVLFENLNELYDLAPELYKQIEMTVKLPKNEDANWISEFLKDLDRILENLKDEAYLNSYVEPEEGEANVRSEN